MNKKCHIFGMAKSSLNLKGAKRQKLELDLLRLIYAIKFIETNNETECAKGYILVAKEVKETVQMWLKKYYFDNNKIIILEFEPTKKMIEEKKRNQKGINGENKIDAKADESQSITETYFKNTINEKEGVKNYEAVDYNKNHNFPNNINWDYYYIKS